MSGLLPEQREAIVNSICRIGNEILAIAEKHREGERERNLKQLNGKALSIARKMRRADAGIYECEIKGLNKGAIGILKERVISIRVGQRTSRGWNLPWSIIEKEVGLGIYSWHDIYMTIRGKETARERKKPLSRFMAFLGNTIKKRG